MPTLEEALANRTFRYATAVHEKRKLARSRPWNGRSVVGGRNKLVVPSAEDPDLRISMIFTYDEGAHASGWWRNSDYETCWHLSICGLEDKGAKLVTAPELDLRLWNRLWMGNDYPKAWIEPPAAVGDPYRNAPASSFTTHFRVFTDKQGNSIIPEGEVYTLKPFNDGSSPEKIFR